MIAKDNRLFVEAVLPIVIGHPLALLARKLWGLSNCTYLQQRLCTDASRGVWQQIFEILVMMQTMSMPRLTA